MTTPDRSPRSSRTAGAPVGGEPSPAHTTVDRPESPGRERPDGSGHARERYRVVTPRTERADRLTDPRADRTGRRATGYERDGLGPVLVKLQQRAFALLRLVDDDRFLDVGCATGAAVRAAAGHAHTAVGVDHSPRMIEHARSHARSPDEAHYAVAAAERLPFPAHAFTAVLCTTVLHYLDHPDRALTEMTRVLRPGGRLVIGDLQPDAPATRSPHARICPGLAVTHRRRTLTPLGFYVITLLAQPPDQKPTVPHGRQGSPWLTWFDLAGGRTWTDS